MMYAMSSAAGASNAALDWAAIAGSLMSMTARSHPSKRDRRSVSSDRGDRLGIADHELHARRRVRGIHRQVSRPGLEHRHDRHDRLSRTRQQQRDPLTGTRALTDQQVRQPIRRLIEFAVRHRRTLEAQRDRLRNTRHLPGEQNRNRHRHAGRLGKHCSVTPRIESGMLGLVEQIDRRQRPLGIGGHRFQHPL